jgi:hypothetical protein
MARGRKPKSQPSEPTPAQCICEIGTFGPVSDVRILNDKEKRAVERDLKRRGILKEFENSSPAAGQSDFSPSRTKTRKLKSK